MSPRMFSIVLWNTSGANEIPKGSRRKKYRPNGVMNVVSFAVASSSGSCQKPDVASSFMKTVEPLSLCMTSSRVGSMYLSLFTARFSFFRSTQMRTPPPFFITGTIGAHQSVGSVMRSMTPFSSMRWSSCSTFGSRGSGILRAVEML